MSVSGKAFDSTLLRRVFRFTRPYRKLFWVSLGLTILLALLGPLRPLMTQYILDHYLGQGDSQGLLMMSVSMVVVLLVQSIVQYFHTWSTNDHGPMWYDGTNIIGFRYNSGTSKFQGFDGSSWVDLN